MRANGQGVVGLEERPEYHHDTATLSRSFWVPGVSRAAATTVIKPERRASRRIPGPGKVTVPT